MEDTISKSNKVASVKCLHTLSLLRRVDIDEALFAAIRDQNAALNKERKSLF